MTGRTSESLSLNDDDEDDEFNWSDFYRAQFADVVTAESIAAFKTSYQGSEEEKMAVLEAYVMFEGDMDAVFEHVMLSEVEADEERFRRWIDEEIEMKRVEGYERYVKEGKGKRKRRRENARREAEEAREMAREMGIEEELYGEEDAKSGAEEDNDEHDDEASGSMPSTKATASPSKKRKSAANGTSAKKPSKSDTSGLAALIAQRQQQRSRDFLADLEAKYAPKSAGKKGKRGRADVEEPPEEAFEMNRKRSRVVGEDDDENAEEMLEKKGRGKKAAVNGNGHRAGEDENDVGRRRSKRMKR